MSEQDLISNSDPPLSCPEPLSSSISDLISFLSDSVLQEYFLLRHILKLLCYLLEKLKRLMVYFEQIVLIPREAVLIPPVEIIGDVDIVKDVEIIGDVRIIGSLGIGPDVEVGLAPGAELSIVIPPED